MALYNFPIYILVKGRKAQELFKNEKFLNEVEESIDIVDIRKIILKYFMIDIDNHNDRGIISINDDSDEPFNYKLVIKDLQGPYSGKFSNQV